MCVYLIHKTSKLVVMASYDTTDVNITDALGSEYYPTSDFYTFTDSLTEVPNLGIASDGSLTPHSLVHNQTTNAVEAVEEID